MLIQKKIGGIYWEVREEFAKTLETEIIPCIKKFDELLNSQGFAFFRIKSSKQSLSSRRFLFYPTSQGDIFIKRCRRQKLLIHVGSVFRKMLKIISGTDRDSREWKNLNQAFWKDGPTPEPLAISRRVALDSLFYITFESYIICRRLDGFVPMPSYMADLVVYNPQKIFHSRRILAKELAKLIANLHNRGIFPKDLNPKNFLIKEGKEIELKIVDFENVYFKDASSSREEVVSTIGKMTGKFMKLGEEIRQPVRKVDRLRFLKEYLRLRAIDYSPEMAREMEDYAKAQLKRLETFCLLHSPFFPQPS